MADRYRTPGGWTIEVVRLAGNGDQDVNERLRIRHHGFYVADVRTVADLARWIPAAELECLERDTLILAAWHGDPSMGRQPLHNRPAGGSAASAM